MAKEKYAGLSGPERMFRKSLDELGAKCDGFMFHPPVDWLPTQYGYRVTRSDGTVKAGIIDWDLDTFSRILKEAKS